MKTSKENFIQFNRFFSRQTRLRWMKIDQVCQMSMDECWQKLYTTRYKKLRTYNSSLPSSRVQTYFGRSPSAAASLNSCVRNCAKILLPLPLQNLVCLAKKKFAECNALFSDGGEWRGGPLLKYKTSYYIVPALPCPPLHLPPPILMCK